MPDTPPEIPPTRSRPFKPLERRELSIHSWSEDFEGESTFQKSQGPLRKIFVPCSMPGDVIEAAIHKPHRGHCRGALTQVIIPASNRIPARCQHFEVCGGCRLQHVPIQDQQQLKQEKVMRLLAPFTDSATRFLPISGADCPWEYRNKMEFSFSSNAKGERYLGLMGLNGRGRVINLEVCHLAESWMAELLKMVRSWWNDHQLTAYHPHRNTGTLRTLTLRQGFASGDRLVMLTVSGRPEDALPSLAMQDFVKRLQPFCCQEKPGATLSCFVRIQQLCKGLPTQFYEMLLHGPGMVREELVVQARAEQPSEKLVFEVGPTSFFQPNPAQAEKLYSLALQMANLTPETTLYDLCCGTATLGIAACRFVGRVIGVELSPESLLDAKTNCKLNGCNNVTFHQGDVAVIAAQLAEENSGTCFAERVVIVDPPRSGLVEAAQKGILALRPKQIISISCNPTSQARDIAKLTASGYRLAVVQPVECFPHTPHIENIALLERRPEHE